MIVYGYGADTSQVTSFKVGGPYPGEEITRTISESGARSINVDDINKIAKIGEVKDGVNVDIGTDQVVVVKKFL